SGAFPGEKGRVFYGVGQMKGTSNPSLLRSMADTRARADIAKTLNSYTAVLSKSYQAATTAGDMSKDTATADEQHVSEAIKQFTSIETSGIEIVKHWYAPDNSVFSLARLDLQGMKDNLDKMKELNAKVRDAVRANADKAFDELAAEEAKKKNGQ